jgi:hypothetical protein
MANETEQAQAEVLAALVDLLRFAEPLGTVTSLSGNEIALPCILRARQAIAAAQALQEAA